ncbi:Cft2 family RNA processing exonuclease [Thermosporothrix hazakensis]|jgi:Cft2 family RNA processing exonuclease|uniref:Cft2 family RNA processing exonuclease n=1 Tax=Thermosporothrix hazakensis TaxID=644383 RepID=A0A326U9P8_THEHA|nr:MBL fold metallo-hydrolase [Thermosporothrix hazakensis]PZW32811.1 Cft2 family RNA processing exonuclease [Thermosporothrix hazakensis]GCE50167.1 hypothetical protein KTH_50360 [Thermosporothrix hazakensis]
MEITFLGGASEVGASCHLLRIAGRTFLIDGGMRPAAREGQSRLPDLSLLDRHPPEAILITHAHIDHTGAMPLIASLFPHLPIYATEATKVLTEILLRDSVRIMEIEGLKPDGETPLYTADQVDAFLGRITPVGLDQSIQPLADAPDLLVTFLRAGHILGAAMLYITSPEGTVLHTGDISVTDQRTIKGLDLTSLPQADVMICEGTYGNRSHTNRKEEERKLAETVQATLEQGGRVLCPAFAVGRAQEIVLILKSYRASGHVSPVPIFLDGMVRSVCQAYQSQVHDLHPSLQRYLTNARRPLFTDPDLHLYAVRAHQRQALIASKKPAIVISSSGMLSGGASPLYAAEVATREKDCLLFTGYQDEEAPGAAFLAAKRGDTVKMGDKWVQLACRVERYNLSGHADAEQIVHTVTKVRPRTLILVHGAPEALEALANRFSRIEIEIPGPGETLVLTPTRVELPPLIEPPVLSEKSDVVPLPVTVDLPDPTVRDLWERARTQGPQRPWTVVELGKAYYGASYMPTLRSRVEVALKGAAPYFKLRTMGAQMIYLPRPQEEVEELHPLTMLTPGELVIVQGGKGTPHLGLVLAGPSNGQVALVSDQWKAGEKPLQMVQLVPGIERKQWLVLEHSEIKQQLQQWHKAIEQAWVDLFVLWTRQQGQPLTYEQLCQQTADETERLAYGIELLAKGAQLFKRQGGRWYPIGEEVVRKNVGFVQHLELLQAGAGAAVWLNGERWTLTGRSNWKLFEIRNHDGEVRHVRANLLSLYPSVEAS